MHKIILLFSLLAFSYSQQAEITNIQAAQRTDGSQIVDITYDLLPDPVFEFFEVTVKVSLDGGISYFPMQNVIGDLGDIIEPGTGKTLTWNFGQQYEGTYSNHIKIKIEGSSFAIVDNNSNQELPFEMVSVPSGEYTFGENDEIRAIDYDYEMMKYPVTDMDYVLFMMDKLAESNANGAIQCDTCMENCIVNWINQGSSFEEATELCYGNPDSDYGCGDTCSDVEGSFTVNLTESALAGYYPGDSNYPAGDYTYIDFNNSKISWNGEIFEVQEGNVNHPVTGVTYFGAWAFALHYGMAVPDQYEWEKAARGNTGYDYPWGNDISIAHANYIDFNGANYGLSIYSTSSVGSFNGSAYECIINENTNGTIGDVFINELHYDNYGSDVGEGFEIIGPSGTDLSYYYLQLYNGNNGSMYNEINLSGIIGPSNTIWFQTETNSFQNGAPDGLALCIGTSGLVQFLSYEGTMTAFDGCANGTTSTDIGVSEPGEIGESLQLTGLGTTYNEFQWIGPIASTYNQINQGQIYSSDALDCDPFITENSSSQFGSYDMAGNTWEIVKSNDDSYLIKGGAYNSLANDLKSWNHQSYTATTTSIGIGFRCLRVIDQSRSNKSSRRINRKHHSLDSQKKIDKSFKNK
ncbi:MAG: SUMF1/EgtB/PvdO family nonheme iron enzyme [Candidatus Marinimicrobia bacterium]|jgi:formylglycine-generating enzyme required for sulfatase activity|nr:SUMF1/EgtB/PvdO family nonheme iron enzyme [Candidatus Neomarinimicrobiota bacterium]